jgi:dihydrofolate reductase
MRILGLEDVAPRLAQPFYDFLLGGANLQASFLPNLLAERCQVTQPPTALTGQGQQATNHFNHVCLLIFGQGLQIVV